MCEEVDTNNNKKNIPYKVLISSPYGMMKKKGKRNEFISMFPLCMKKKKL